MATISENLQAIIDIKADIKTAIENKGVEVGNVGFNEYAGKIDSIESGITWKLPNGTKFTNGPTSYSALYFDNLTSCYNMFNECANLTSIPLFDTSNVISMEQMFYDCYNLTSIPLFDTSNVENIEYFLYNTSITELPQFDFSNVRYIRGFVNSCGYLTTLPLLNFGNVIAASADVYYLFSDCYNLENVGGFTDLGKSFDIGGYAANVDFSACSKLTRESCLNVFNSIFDLTTIVYNYMNARITLNATTYALLTADDIAIATNKGWIVESA